MRTRGAALAAATLATVALPASAALAPGERVPLPAAATWSTTRSDMAIGDDGTIAWVSTRRVDGQDDVVVRVRAPGAATWTAAQRVDGAGVDTGAAPVVGVDGDGEAVVAWTEDLVDADDVLVARRVSSDGVPGPRLEPGSGADGRPVPSGPLTLDVASSGAAVLGFTHVGGAQARAAAVTIGADDEVDPWRHPQPADQPLAAGSLDVAVDEQGRTWAAWTTSDAVGSTGRAHLARLTTGGWVSTVLPGDGAAGVRLESGHDLTALAWTGDGDGDGTRDDVLSLTVAGAAAGPGMPTAWDPTAAGRHATIADRTAPLLTVHRSRAWLSTRSLASPDAARSVDVRASADDGTWGSAVPITSAGSGDAVAQAWLVTGEPDQPTLAVATLRPALLSAYRLDFLEPGAGGAWTSQRTVRPLSSAHAVRVEDAGAAHGAAADGFVVVTDDTDSPDSSFLVRYVAVAPPPGTTVAPLPVWSLGTVRVAWTSEAPAARAEVRLRRADTSGDLDTGTVQDAPSSPLVVDNLGPGETGCFAARSRVAGSDHGPWSSERCTAVPLDDRGLAASPTWTSRTGAAYYRGTVRTTTRSGATLSRTVSAVRRLALVASTCPGCGRVRVLLGSTPLATLDLSRPAAARRLLPVASFASARSGPVKVRVVSSGRKVAVDGLGASRR